METNIKTIYHCLTVLVLLVAGPMQTSVAENAEEAGFKTIVCAENKRITCYESATYLVVAKDLESKGGTDFVVKYKSSADDRLPCRYGVQGDDFEIKNEWVEYFAGLMGDFLILDSTTGPGPSGLTIWDLRKRKKVFEGCWASPMEIKEDSIVYWDETGEATDDNCPERAEWESHGLGAAIETKVILRFSDFSVLETEETRCSPRQ
jgi:hypothetical protein